MLLNLRSVDLKFLKIYRKTKSSISLVDADPGRDRNKRAAFAMSATEEVIFQPKNFRKNKEEL